MLTAANNGEKTDGRAADGTFLNRPGPGRPRGKTLQTLIREAVDDSDDPAFYPQVLVWVKGLAQHAEKESDRLAAIKLLLEWRVPRPLEFEIKGTLVNSEIQSALISIEEADEADTAEWIGPPNCAELAISDARAGNGGMLFGTGGGDAAKPDEEAAAVDTHPTRQERIHEHVPGMAVGEPAEH